jgi:hypothetical protein
MDDTEQKAIDALRAAGLEAEAWAVERLRASLRATVEAFQAAQRSSYQAGLRAAQESALTAVQPAPDAWGVYVGDVLMKPFGNLGQATDWARMERLRGSDYAYHIRDLYAGHARLLATDDRGG